MIAVFSRGKYSVVILHNIGPKRLETKTRPKIEKGQTGVTFNETLSILTTLYKDIKKGSFQERSVNTLDNKCLGKSCNSTEKRR